MIRLRMMSDLHLEFGPIDLEPADEDVLVLAGDVGLFTDGAEWAIDYAVCHSIPVVMIAGNHEFYRNPRMGHTHTVRSTLDALRRLNAREPLFTFLEDNIATVAGVTFVGATLWTDYALYGDPAIGRLVAQRGLNDHRLILDDVDAPFTTQRALNRHEFSVGVLRERLPRRYDDGRSLVVVTHHLPSARSIHPDYADDTINAAYMRRTSTTSSLVPAPRSGSTGTPTIHLTTGSMGHASCATRAATHCTTSIRSLIRT